MSIEIDLDGTRALVTGAGAGIGREIARWLARAGASVAVADVRADKAAETCSLIVDEATGEAFSVVADARDDAQLEGMVAEAAERLGGLDVAVNNIGMLGPRGSAPLLDLDGEAWRDVLDQNLVLTALSMSAEARVMQGQDSGGVIVNVSSGETTRPAPGLAGYGAAKAGIASFSLIAAQELVRYGVTVNCLAPTAVSRLTIPLMGGEENLSESAMEAMSPRWIALVATWLCSAEAQNVTGRMFDIRGRHLGIAEGWHLGPTAEQPDEPGELGTVMESLMKQARLNADMSGGDHEGPGFPSQGL